MSHHLRQFFFVQIFDAQILAHPTNQTFLSSMSAPTGAASRFLSNASLVSSNANGNTQGRKKINFKSKFMPAASLNLEQYLPKPPSANQDTTDEFVRQEPEFISLLSPADHQIGPLRPGGLDDYEEEVEEADAILTKPEVEKALALQRQREESNSCNACGKQNCSCIEEQDRLIEAAVVRVEQMALQDERRLSELKRKRSDELRNSALVKVDEALAPPPTDPVMTPPRRRTLSDARISSPAKSSPGLLNLIHQPPTQRRRHAAPARDTLVTAAEPRTAHDRHLSRDGHLLLTQDISANKVKIDLRPYFMLKSADAARSLGMSTSGLSKLFTRATHRQKIRDLEGNTRVKRWPNRQLVRVDSEIRMLCCNNNITFTGPQLSFCFRRPNSLANIAAASEELDQSVAENAGALAALQARPRDQLSMAEAQRLAELANEVKDAQIAKEVSAMLQRNKVPEESVQLLHKYISYRMIDLIGTTELYVEVRCK